MKLLFTCLLAAATVTAMSQQKAINQFVLNGTLSGQDQGWIYFDYWNVDGTYVKDSVAITSGRFSFRGNIKEPTRASLWLKTEKPGAGNFINFFMEPVTMTVGLLPGQFKKAAFTGSKTQGENELLQAAITKLDKRWKTVMDTLAVVNKKSNFQYQALKDWVLEPYFEERKEISYAFFNKYPASYITAYNLLVEGRELSTDSLKLFYGRFPEKLKQSNSGKNIFAEIEARKIGIPRTVAAGFASTDIDGKMLNLSDFKGKYVLLDFWASWCLPCRQLSPHLKELYAKYKALGFEVIGIASDDTTQDAWKKAVTQDDLPWPEILSGAFDANRNLSPATNIGKRYNIGTLPTQILVDPTGKIIGRYGDKGEPHEMLDKKLDLVFKN